ncbi:hypothetical protein [Kitasatospora sp. NPDC057198]|uniref:hypothetical protein n=1 Tax=Kitasatospora sp. NPDC057198 TaxID=3346046 RepID=UPI0036316C2F
MRTPRYYLDLANDSFDPAVLRELAGSAYPFVQRAVAANPHAPAAALLELTALCGRTPVDPLTWNENHLLLLVARHPAADRAVLSAAVAAAAVRLTAGARPYQAVLALAEHPGTRPEELLALGRLPGASARLRRGLRRALAARPGPDGRTGAGDQAISRSTP